MTTVDEARAAALGAWESERRQALDAFEDAIRAEGLDVLEQEKRAHAITRGHLEDCRRRHAEGRAMRDDRPMRADVDAEGIDMGPDEFAGDDGARFKPADVDAARRKFDEDWLRDPAAWDSGYEAGRAAALDEADRAIEKAQTGEQEIARLTGRTIDSVLRVSGMGMARAAIDALREGADKD